jgi:Ca2+-binding EF-hand superfamily protein
MRKVLIVAAGVLCAASVLGQGREGPGAMFDHADTDGDGAVSRDEFVSTRTEQFGKRDRNGDGFVDTKDLGERASARPRVSQAMSGIVKQFDVDHDGKLSKDEFVAGGLKIFERADADHNGSLDEKEREGAKAAVKARADERAKAGESL